MSDENFPQLKKGTQLFATTKANQYLLGSPDSAIAISTLEAKSVALALLQGDLKGARANNPELTSAIINALHQKELLDLNPGKLILSPRYISNIPARADKQAKGVTDGALLQLKNRITPELLQSTWVGGATDGGVATLQNREKFLVEITGANGIATLLYPILLASGVTQVRYAADSRGKKHNIEDLDIAISGFKSADIGFDFNKEREDRRRDYSLFPLDKSLDYLDDRSTPDLIVLCGNLDSHKIALWMSSGQPFLYIPSPIGNTAQIGPLVAPGVSPCQRCAELFLADQRGFLTSSAISSRELPDFPVVAAHLIAALAASILLTFTDEGIDKATGFLITLGYQDIRQPQMVAITRHPLCGCSFNQY